MADYDLPNALSVRVTETPGSLGPAIPTPARITRTFTVADGTVLAELDVIAEAARGEGWNLEERIPTGYVGNKIIDGLYSQISITGIEFDNVLWVGLMTGDR
ncbi:MAG: hypothetical protein BMS9Abin07_0566 [Acidimicrobiia bacterium]|nr:MAG: hypothetical protein BMS9Abin07_0566 [Acidimicrobiia bacterium]